MMGRQKTKGRKVKKPPEQLIKQPHHGGRPDETKEEYRKRLNRESKAAKRSAAQRPPAEQVSPPHPGPHRAPPQPLTPGRCAQAGSPGPTKGDENRGRQKRRMAAKLQAVLEEGDGVTMLTEALRQALKGEGRSHGALKPDPGGVCPLSGPGSTLAPHDPSSPLPAPSQSLP